MLHMLLTTLRFLSTIIPLQINERIEITQTAECAFLESERIHFSFYDLNQPGVF